MRNIAALVLLLVLFAAEGVCQEQATLRQTGKELVLTVDSTRPMVSIAETLAQNYGVLVSGEEPISMSPLDMVHVDAAYSESKAKKNWLVPKRRRFEVRTPAGSSGWPADMHAFIEETVRAANNEMPFGYRLDTNGEFFAFVPTKTRDANGNVIDAVPVLDRKVTIPNGTRPIAESAKMMADQLSAQTGLKVSCCQMLVAGIPWGLEEVPFGAKNHAARRVLEELIRLEQQNAGINAHCHYWTLTCDHGYCFIDLKTPRDSMCQKAGWVALK